MKLIWNENPLATSIILDSQESRDLWHKIRYEEMRDLLFNVHFYLHDEKSLDLESAKKSCDPEYYFENDDGEKSALDKRVDALHASCISELEHGIHGGDCTCVAASCFKCYAESRIGIDTLEGLDKYGGAKLSGIFGFRGDVTLDSAIHGLENYNPVKGPAWDAYTDAQFQAHVPRWKDDAKRCLDWLKKYRSLHFSK